MKSINENSMRCYQHPHRSILEGSAQNISTVNNLIREIALNCSKGNEKKRVTGDFRELSCVLTVLKSIRIFYRIINYYILTKNLMIL